MGDFINLINGFNLSPFNTCILAVLGFTLRWGIKEIFRRLDAVEERNTKQDLALARIEERLNIGPLT